MRRHKHAGSRRADFLREPVHNAGAPRFSLMIRIGSWMLTEKGLYRWYCIPSVNGKVTRFDWVQVL